jgi:hypothetical protein
MKHWAYDLIGKPHAPDGFGPTHYSCWGLLRRVFLMRYGIHMPEVVLNDEIHNNVRAIKEAARVSGWRRVSVAEHSVEDGDILVFPRPKLHVALAVVANGRLGVLESTHETGVVWRPWAQAVSTEAYFEVWRKE